MAVYENDDYLESIAVMLFYQVGEWFQSYAVEWGGKLVQVDPDGVGIGIIVIQPGEKVPIDSTVVQGDSTVSKILDLVENAASLKSKSEDFISHFAKIYTPAVCYVALALATLPTLVRMFGMGLAAD